MNLDKKTILIIGGPTASGKTGFAIKCAKKFNGEIISCDSMQIYKDLDIGTAKATQKEQQEVKHHLIDIVNPNQDFSVQEYVKLARNKIDDIVSRGKLPIIVGGTGLYIRSLIYPYSFCKTTKDETIRQKYKDILEKEGKEYLYQLLKQKDFDATKKIHMNDTKRVIRALEICDLANDKKTNLNLQDEKETVYNVIFVALNLDRQRLYEKINLRVDKMIGMGLIKEFIDSLKKYNLTPESQSMQAIGYSELFGLIPKNLNQNTSQKMSQNTTQNSTQNLTQILTQSNHQKASFEKQSNTQQMQSNTQSNTQQPEEKNNQNLRTILDILKEKLEQNSKENIKENYYYISQDFMYNLEFENSNEIFEIIKKDTRNYAKRQITFFKGFKDLVAWFDSEKEGQKALDFIEQKLKDNLG